MTRYILFGISILLGFIGSVYYGWADRPVRATDAAPAVLRQDFRSDYTLMVAEAFQNDHNTERAIASLGFLATTGKPYNPYGLVSDALTFGTKNGYAVTDLGLLQTLQSALLEFDPTLAGTPTP